MNSFAKKYFRCWNYIKSCKIQIYWVISLFFIFSVIGFFVPVSDKIMNVILEYIKEILSKTEGMSVGGLISFIFLNNFQASFLGLVLGLFFGVFPAFFAIFNGYVLGVVASITVSQEGFFSLLRLFPHGIFELPAVFISLGMGMKLGSVFFQKNKMKFFKENFEGAMYAFFLVVVPLLIIAAVVEGALIFLAK